MDVTDKAIEAAAPGYRQYMDNYAAASRKIDAMEALQSHREGLFDAGNRMGYAKFQTMMRNIVDRRQSEGLNEYKSITDETMDKLWAIRDDLRRSASAKELANAPGSDTAQNAWDAIRRAAGGPGAEAALHTLAAGVPGGNLAVSIGRSVLSPFMAARREQRGIARGLEMLNPPPPNLLTPP
jgi:hypothetical protein